MFFLKEPDPEHKKLFLLKYIVLNNKDVIKNLETLFLSFFFNKLHSDNNFSIKKLQG